MEPDQREQAAAGIAALQRWYRPWTGLWRTAGWWNAANALTAVIAYTARTGDQAHAGVIETTFRHARRRNADFVNKFYDDNLWWGLAWADAFDLTGESRYLDAARVIFERCLGGWDDTCGGGLWWNRDRKYKNAITNELFLTLAARLHRRVPDAGPYYLDWALREWDWFRSIGMIGPGGLVNDGLTDDCANNGGITWTYNQGVILGGLAALHEITGDPALLAQGEVIADAALRTLVTPADAGPPGILTEALEAGTSPRDGDRPQFKGVFVRHLHDFARRSGRGDYQEFIAANAASLWSRARNDQDQFGLCWSGPFDRADASRQSAALDLLNAAVSLASG